jgi:hypothetical protein
VRTTDKAVIQIGSCLTYFWFGVGALIAFGIAFVIARWTGVIVLALVIAAWLLILRNPSQHRTS